MINIIVAGHTMETIGSAIHNQPDISKSQQQSLQALQDGFFLNVSFPCSVLKYILWTIDKNIKQINAPIKYVDIVIFIFFLFVEFLMAPGLGLEPRITRSKIWGLSHLAIPE